MTLFNDLWKKFKETPSIPSHFSESTSTSNTAVIADDKPKTSQTTKKEPLSKKPPREAKKTTSNNIEQVLNAFADVELESIEQVSLNTKMKALKKLVDEPKEEKPELRFTQIKEKLGLAETHATVRQERWPDEIKCPSCSSVRLRRLMQEPTKSSHNHRYQCLDCGHVFNDDSGTPMEQGIPPLNIWMQCWYLMGCTDSLIYIAHKLSLDLATIEMMVDRLQKAFNALKPLTRFIGFDEWSKQSQHLRAQLKEDLLRDYELLNANVATVPKDTAEFRRQQNIRRELTPTIMPPSPTGGGRKR